MRLRSKLTKISAAVLVLAVATVTGMHTRAAAPGQIGGGDGILKIANVTKGSGYANTQSADQCDTLEYRVFLYNPGPSALTGVKIEASINTVTPRTQTTPSVTVFTPDGNPTSVGAQATLNFSTAQTQAYVAGSTQLLDSAGNVIKPLPDGITMGAGGIDLGNIGESVSEYVKFRTKLSCSPPPVQPAYSCDMLNASVADNTRKATITAFNTSQSGGATFKNVVIDWGDGSAPLTTASAVGQMHDYTADGTYTISAVAHFDVNGQDVTAAGAACSHPVTVHVTQPPAPSYSCDSLGAAIDERMVTVTGFTTSQANGATFKNVVVDWGDNTANTTTDTLVGKTHTYSKDGTYNIVATAHFTVNGEDKTDSGAGCRQIVVVSTHTTPPPTPSCEAFDMTANDHTVSITNFKAPSVDGAKFKDVIIDWGDNSDKVTTATPIGVSHKYAQDGSYTVSATARFTLDNGDVVSDSGPECTRIVVFSTSTPPMVTPPPATPGTTITTASSHTTSSQPTTLVNTGAGSVIGLFAVVTLIGAVSHRYLLMRRISQS